MLERLMIEELNRNSSTWLAFVRASWSFICLKVSSMNSWGKRLNHTFWRRNICKFDPIKAAWTGLHFLDRRGDTGGDEEIPSNGTHQQQKSFWEVELEPTSSGNIWNTLEHCWQSLVLRRFDGLLARVWSRSRRLDEGPPGREQQQGTTKSHRAREDRYEKLVMLVVVGI